MDAVANIRRQSEARRRRAVRAAAAEIYLAEYNVPRLEGCTDENARQRGWLAREKARAVLIVVQS